MKLHTIYRAYDCTEAGGPAGDGSGPSTLLGHFSSEADARKVAENKGWRSWDLKDKHGRVDSIQILSSDGGLSGYTSAGSPLIRVNPLFIEGNADPFHVKLALEKLTDTEQQALKKHYIETK
jgi:hypothetical protein